jgi:hypothetical protein
MDIDKIKNLEFFFVAHLLVAIYDKDNIVIVSLLTPEYNKSKACIQVVPIKKSISSSIISWFGSGIDDKIPEENMYDISIYREIEKKNNIDKLDPELSISASYSKSQIELIEMSHRDKKLEYLIK